MPATLPIRRYLADLSENGKYESCLRKLVDAFNPLTIDGPMCRSMMSVEWQGNVFDCDFHRMLNLKVASRGSTNILDLNDQSLDEVRHCPITGKHCFGCTAGAGSSCSGSLK